MKFLKRVNVFEEVKMKNLKMWWVVSVAIFACLSFFQPVFSQVYDAEEYLEEEYEKQGFTKIKDFSIDENGEPVCEGRKCARKNITWEDTPTPVKTTSKLVKAIPRDECRVEGHRELEVKFRLRYKEEEGITPRRKVREDGWIEEVQEENRKAKLIGYYIFERDCAEEYTEWRDIKLTFRARKPKPVFEIWPETKISPVKKVPKKTR